MGERTQVLARMLEECAHQQASAHGYLMGQLQLAARALPEAYYPATPAKPAEPPAPSGQVGWGHDPHGAAVLTPTRRGPQQAQGQRDVARVSPEPAYAPAQPPPGVAGVYGYGPPCAAHPSALRGYMPHPSAAAAAAAAAANTRPHERTRPLLPPQQPCGPDAWGGAGAPPQRLSPRRGRPPPPPQQQRQQYSADARPLPHPVDAAAGAPSSLPGEGDGLPLGREGRLIWGWLAGMLKSAGVTPTAHPATWHAVLAVVQELEAATGTIERLQNVRTSAAPGAPAPPGSCLSEGDEAKPASSQAWPDRAGTHPPQSLALSSHPDPAPVPPVPYPYRAPAARAAGPSDTDVQRAGTQHPSYPVHPEGPSDAKDLPLTVPAPPSTTTPSTAGAAADSGAGAVEGAAPTAGADGQAPLESLVQQVPDAAPWPAGDAMELPPPAEARAASRSGTASAGGWPSAPPPHSRTSARSINPMRLGGAAPSAAASSSAAAAPPPPSAVHERRRLSVTDQRTEDALKRLTGELL